MQNWKSIWAKRELTSEYDTVLSKLISADGFDTGFGTIKEEDWISYIDHVSAKLNIIPNDSIYEVGCGSGAFLYNFYKNKHNIGGIDYSENLIVIANQYLEAGQFKYDEAIMIDEKIKYDTVLSNGVFFYFPSLEYAKKVLNKMINKATKSIAILDVSDQEWKNKSLKIRKGNMTEEEYSKRYSGLDHLYYSKQWFIDIALKHNLKIEIEQQNINNYQNNSYRFNVFLYR